MADRFYGIDRGEQGKGEVTEGSSSTATTDVEVRIDLAANMEKQEVLNALDVIKQAIFEDTWPPA
jgi:hypothetical protein